MIKILLVDDQRLTLETLKAVLQDEPEMEIVGTARDGISAIALIVKLQPDIVLMDIKMPRMNGIATAEYINRHLSDTKVIILTNQKEQSYLAQALKAGVSSYLAKDSSIQDLKQAIYCLSRGYSYLNIELLNKAVKQIQANNIVNNRTTYIKKYRKKIYIPFVATPSDKSYDLETTEITRRVNRPTASKAAASVFSLSNIDKVKTAQYSATAKAYWAKKKNAQYQKLWKKGIFLAIAIASLILSIIIF